MYTRSAIFQGKIHSGREDEFFDTVEKDLLPIWRRMPGALAIRVMRTRHSDHDAPGIVLVQEIDYASAEAVEVALASPVRAEGRAATDKLMTMFDGHFTHLVYERLALDLAI